MTDPHTMVFNREVGKRLLKVEEAARYLGLEVDTVYKKARFLARSMAGITMGISVRTAQDLLAKTESEKLEVVYRPMCVCGHRERDHKDRGRCKYCICADYQYSGGRELASPGGSPDETSAR